MESDRKSQQEINNEIHTALWGNTETGEIGIVAMTHEMHDAWSAIMWLGKFAMWLAVFLGAVGGFWVAFGSSIKHLVTGK